MLEAPSIAPNEIDNIINDPVAFLKVMIPDLKIQPWQEEILRTLEDPRWKDLPFRYACR